MNISAPFIARPVATTLLTLAVVMAGALGFWKLPVSPMPQVDFPTIVVNAQLPGASAATVATSVAEPLERHLGQIADVTDMTSTSAIGATRIALQFGINRDIDGAARDVQAAITAARADLPLEHNSVLTDVSSDQQQRGLETFLEIDRDTTARLGISPRQIDNTLYDAFGQRQVSVIYRPINQYHVVMEIDPRYAQYPTSLRDVYVGRLGQRHPTRRPER
jgi:multidrug efflux pump subunit AcrB